MDPGDEAALAAFMALAERIPQQPPHALRMANTLLRQGATPRYETLM